jgi:hypothetical protein
MSTARKPPLNSLTQRRSPQPLEPSATRRRGRYWVPGSSYGIRRCTRILILASERACSSGLNRSTRSIMAVRTRSTPLAWDRRPIRCPARPGIPLLVQLRAITIPGLCSLEQKSSSDRKIGDKSTVHLVKRCTVLISNGYWNDLLFLALVFFGLFDRSRALLLLNID